LSVDIYFVMTEALDQNEDLWSQVVKLSDTAGGGNPEPELKKLHDLLVQKYPEYDEADPNSSEDDCVWADGPILNNFGARIAHLGLRSSIDEDVYVELIKMGLSNGFAVADPQNGEVFLPRQ